MAILLDSSISAQTPDPTPITTTGFVTVPTPIPTHVPPPLADPPYEVNLSEIARQEPTRLGIKVSLDLL
jgi:hypothetical protein